MILRACHNYDLLGFQESMKTTIVGPLTSLRYVKAMRHAYKARTIAFLVVAVTSLVDHTDNALAQAPPCRSREYAHNAYTVCEVDLAKHTVRLYWKRSDGTPYAYLSSLPRALQPEAG
jgi:hypothetical protein